MTKAAVPTLPGPQKQGTGATAFDFVQHWSAKIISVALGA